MDLFDVIKSRRSVRKFKDTPISEPDIKLLIESARIAPSGGNAQNWIFGIVTDKNKIRALSEAAGNQQWISTAPLVIALCTKLQKNFQKLKEDDFELQVDKKRFGDDLIEYLKKYPDQDSIAILFENSNPLIPGEHIFLTAISLGLHACWVGYLDVKKSSLILNLPKNIACLYLMPIGYADEAPSEKERKTYNQITFNNEWDSTQP